MKQTLIILFLICGSLAIAGNSDREKVTKKTVAGRITDQTGNTVTGISITIVETGDVFFADFEGQFNLALNADKAYTLRVSSIGFAPLEVKSNELNAFSDLTLQNLD